MDIRSLFPTPIATFSNFINEKERLELFKIIKNTPHSSHGSIEGDGGSTHTSTLRQLSNFVDNNIKKRIQSAVDEYTEIYGIGSVKLHIIWSNIQNSGSRLEEHGHAGSIVSGALYINVGKDCKLCFHNPNPHIYFTEKSADTLYNYEYQWIKAENAKLVLFPSWLRHGKYSVVNEMDNRIVVSFNCSR